MKQSIKNFSFEKAKKTVIKSSKIEGYSPSKSKSLKLKARKLASLICP